MKYILSAVTTTENVLHFCQVCRRVYSGVMRKKQTRWRPCLLFYCSISKNRGRKIVPCLYLFFVREGVLLFVSIEILAKRSTFVQLASFQRIEIFMGFQLAFRYL